jgi:hypothetical protein
MRKLTLLNLSVLFLFALVAAVEGSVQTEPVEPPGELQSPAFQEARHSCLAAYSRMEQARMPVLVIFHDFAVFLVEPRAPQSLLRFSPDYQVASAENANVGICSELGRLGIPHLMMHACVPGISLDSQGSCALAESAGLPQHALPEPATIAVWSLIGLCWSVVSCWRRRRGLSQSGIGADRPQMRRCVRRPPWPDDVRARILEIIERGGPR